MIKSETVSDSTLAVDDEPRTGEVAKVPAAPLRAPRPDEIASIAQAKTRLTKMLPRAMVNTRDGEDGSLQITHAHADGEGWSAQLQSAFGSPSKEFVHHTMAKLLNVICPAGKPLDQDTVNAALAMVDGVKPRDETEALLACQMAASHALAMECLLRTRHTDSLHRFEANGNMATKFLRTFAVQMWKPSPAFVAVGSKRSLSSTSTSMQVDRPRWERSSSNNREGVGMSLKSKVKPMQSPDPTLSPSSQGRCGAKTRNGSPCRTWRVTGKHRCRMHGGAPGSGAPKGSRNGTYKHGGFTCEAIEERRALREMVAEFRDMAKALW